MVFRRVPGDEPLVARVSSSDLLALSGTAAQTEEEGEKVKTAVRQQVEALYRVHNAKKFTELDALFQKYRGKELDLLQAVRKKYEEPADIGMQKLLARSVDQGFDVFSSLFCDFSAGKFAQTRVFRASLPIPASFSDWTKTPVFNHPAPYMATLFIGNRESHPEARDAFREAAASALEEHGNAVAGLQWLTVDAEGWSNVLKNFEIAQSDLPCIRIIGNPGSPKTQKLPTYVFEGDTGSLDDVKTFVDGYVDGSLTPVFKSEEAPEESSVPEGHLPKAVRDTFKELVLDAEGDVLVDVALSNCGACKSLEPVLSRFVTEVEQGTGGVMSKPVALPVYKIMVDKNDLGDMTDVVMQVRAQAAASWCFLIAHSGRSLRSGRRLPESRSVQGGRQVGTVDSGGSRHDCAPSVRMARRACLVEHLARRVDTRCRHDCERGPQSHDESGAEPAGEDRRGL